MPVRYLRPESVEAALAIRPVNLVIAAEGIVISLRLEKANYDFSAALEFQPPFNEAARLCVPKTSSVLIA